MHAALVIRACAVARPVVAHQACVSLSCYIFRFRQSAMADLHHTKNPSEPETTMTHIYDQHLDRNSANHAPLSPLGMPGADGYSRAGTALPCSTASRVIGPSLSAPRCQ